MPIRLALKIDVDTDRGTREGVPALAADCREFSVPACFLFSLGPDQTGRAVRRIWRRGFLGKVRRSGVVGLYGVRTLLNGTLLPAPHIGRRNEAAMRAVRDAGFEIGVHCHNHYRWQDFLHTMTLDAIRGEFAAAQAEFTRIFGTSPRCAGAAGWQSNARSREVYDQGGLLYVSDTRGHSPYFPWLDGRVFQTLEIPTTLPTLDEMLGRPEYPDGAILGYYLERLTTDRVNVFTVHAEIEGMAWRSWFRTFLAACRGSGVEFIRLEDYARDLLASRETIPVAEQLDAPIDGRSGRVATQGRAVAQVAPSRVGSWPAKIERSGRGD